MRPIERKILQKITKDGFSLNQIEEIIDSTSRQELKKSYPDDCHFQSTGYFAKQIFINLARVNFIKRDGNKLFKIEIEIEEKK